MIAVYHLRTSQIVKIKDDKVFVDTVNNIPYATVAVEFNDDGTVNRGISICSPEDSFVKKIGVNKAIGKLNAAKEHKSLISPVPFNKLEKRIMKKYNAVPKYKNNFKFMGGYHVKPTLLELELFKEEFDKATKTNVKDVTENTFDNKTKDNKVKDKKIKGKVKDNKVKDNKVKDKKENTYHIEIN